MLYIQVDVTLIDHPKTKKLARLLGISRMTAVGHLVALWSWAAQYAIDGDLTDYREEPDVVADGAQWDGDPKLFINALINARVGTGHGFIEDGIDGSLLIHDWDEYFGKLLERLAAWENKRKKGNPSRPPVELWNGLRMIVFARDDYTCQYCGRRGGMLECDHKTPISRGGSNDLSNLTTACRECNRSKQTKMVEEWLV